MENFSSYIEKNYNFPLSIPDQKLLHEAEPETLESIQKKVERKYMASFELLKRVSTPAILKTIRFLLKEPPQFCIRSLGRMKELLNQKEAGYFDDQLYDKYHRQAISKLSLYEKLLDLINESKDRQMKPQEFQDYLNSGLFDQGVYNLTQGPSKEELKELVDDMRMEVYTKYQYSLTDKDIKFLKNNRVQNRHIINQIVVPKYRVASEIIQLLDGNFMDSIIQNEIELGMNEGMPVLKRIKSLAVWYSEGYLSIPLIQKYHHTLVHDLDKLEDFFMFMELISEYISKDRAIHYMEMGFYEVFDEKFFKNLLKNEQVLYDISDDISDSVGEYIRIMKTPGASKTLITNRRLSQCFEKFVRAIDQLLEHSDLLEIYKYQDKLENFQNGFIKLYRDYQRKNPSLPTQKPYKAIEFIRPFTRLFFTIESENLLRISLAVYNKSQILLSEETNSDPVLEQAKQRFLFRFQTIHKAFKEPKSLQSFIGQLVPIEQNPLLEVDRYVNGKSN